MSDDRKVIDLSAALDERDELAICRLWDAFQEASVELYTYRDYESLVLVLQSIENVKRHIVKVPRGR
jgi:hypothetical protein